MSWPTLHPSPLAPTPTAHAPPSTSRHRLCQLVSGLPGYAALRAPKSRQAACKLMYPAELLAACPLQQHVPDMLFGLQLMVPRPLRRTTVPQRLHPTAQSLHPTRAAWPGPLLPTHRHQSLACTHLPTPLWAPMAQLRAPCQCTVSFCLRRCWEPGCTEGSMAGCFKTAAEQLEACPASLSQGSQSGSGAPVCSRDDCSSLAHCTTQPRQHKRSPLPSHLSLPLLHGSA